MTDGSTRNLHCFKVRLFDGGDSTYNSPIKPSTYSIVRFDATKVIVQNPPAGLVTLQVLAKTGEAAEKDLFAANTGV